MPKLEMIDETLSVYTDDPSPPRITLEQQERLKNWVRYWKKYFNE